MERRCTGFSSLHAPCRFHLLKPEYIHGRIRELQRAYALRVLLCYVDIDDVVLPLGQIIKTALLNHMTLVCAWSPQVGRHMQYNVPWHSNVKACRRCMLSMCAHGVCELMWDRQVVWRTTS